MPAWLFKMKSGGSSSAMLPLPAGCERREAGRRSVISLEHLEVAGQPKSRSRRSWDAVVSGRSGIVTAQPASMVVAAITAANFMTLQIEGFAGREWSMCIAAPLPLLRYGVVAVA